MHNAAFKHLGLEISYEAHDVPPARLREAVSSLRDEHILGANVTVPHKQAVMPLLDGLNNAATAIGAVNTVVNNKGRLIGHNTDAAGFLRALMEADFEPRDKRVVVLGAGGSGSSGHLRAAHGGSGGGRLQPHAGKGRGAGGRVFQSRNRERHRTR